MAGFAWARKQSAKVENDDGQKYPKTPSVYNGFAEPCRRGTLRVEEVASRP